MDRDHGERECHYPGRSGIGSYKSECRRQYVRLDDQQLKLSLLEGYSCDHTRRITDNGERWDGRGGGNEHRSSCRSRPYKRNGGLGGPYWNRNRNNADGPALRRKDSEGCAHYVRLDV